jgi:hypothetical protein
MVRPCTFPVCPEAASYSYQAQYPSISAKEAEKLALIHPSQWYPYWDQVQHDQFDDSVEPKRKRRKIQDRRPPHLPPLQPAEIEPVEEANAEEEKVSEFLPPVAPPLPNQNHFVPTMLSEDQQLALCSFDESTRVYSLAGAGARVPSFRVTCEREGSRLDHDYNSVSSAGAFGAGLNDHFGWKVN